MWPCLEAILMGATQALISTRLPLSTAPSGVSADVPCGGSHSTVCLLPYEHSVELTRPSLFPSQPPGLSRLLSLSPPRVPPPESSLLSLSAGLEASDNDRLMFRTARSYSFTPPPSEFVLLSPFPVRPSLDSPQYSYPPSWHFPGYRSNRSSTLHDEMI